MLKVDGQQGVPGRTIGEARNDPLFDRLEDVTEEINKGVVIDSKCI